LFSFPIIGQFRGAIELAEFKSAISLRADQSNPAEHLSARGENGCAGIGCGRIGLSIRPVAHHLLTANTTREVLSHLLFEPGFDPAATLATFSERDYPVVEIEAGATFLDEQRRQLTLSQFRDALDAQRRRVLEYIEGLEEPAFERRKARIPLFKQFMGTDEITIDMYLGAMFDYHWNDHAGQLEKIRQAVGLGSAAAAQHGGMRA